jgi:hypothetical protein
VGVFVAHDSSLTTLRGPGGHTRPGETMKPSLVRYGAKDLERVATEQADTTARAARSSSRSNR